MINDNKIQLIPGKLLKKLLRPLRIAGVDGEIEVTHLADGTWSIGLSVENRGEEYEIELDEDGAISVFLVPMRRKPDA